jgi:hypothetical protein
LQWFEPDDLSGLISKAVLTTRETGLFYGFFICLRALMADPGISA